MDIDKGLLGGILVLQRLFFEYVCLAGEHVYLSGHCVDVLVNV